MASLLDIEYDILSLPALKKEIDKEDFQTPYLKTKEDKILFAKYVGGFLADIIQRKEPMVSAIKELDKAQKQLENHNVTQIEKLVNNWLKKAFFLHLKDGYKISKNILLKHLKDKLKPTNERDEKRIEYAVEKALKKNRLIMHKRVFRAKKHDKIKELQERHPNLNVISAFAYGMIEDRANIKNVDIEYWDKILTLLESKKT
ncbi:hypothetical protein [Nitrosophilus labii]|uniref:hypothetical protein n=1 Tax=Nitrosophilus labii TaxID=2706014 RepID=UPI00165763EB|nr:hypothetical protein [Nitrosophilus labii]